MPLKKHFCCAVFEAKSANEKEQQIFVGLVSDLWPIRIFPSPLEIYLVRVWMQKWQARRKRKYFQYQTPDSIDINHNEMLAVKLAHRSLNRSNANGHYYIDIILPDRSNPSPFSSTHPYVRIPTEHLTQYPKLIFDIIRFLLLK